MSARLRNSAFAAVAALAVFPSIAPAQPARQTPPRRGAPPRASAPRSAPARAVRPPAEADFTLGVPIPELPPLALPGFSSRALPSGMRLILSEARHVPLVTGWMIFRAGAQYEPPGRTGLAELSVRLLRSGGIQGMTGAQVDARLAEIGARIEPGHDKRHAWLAFECPSERLEETLRILHGMAAAPALAVEAFDEIETAMRGQIGSRNQYSANISMRELLKTIAGGAAFGRVVEYEDLERIERDDVVAWVARHHLPANAVLALHGDLDAPAAAAAIQRRFDWKAPGPGAQPADFPEPKSHGVLQARTAERERSYFAIGNLLPGKVADPAAVEVMTELLQAHLNQWIRRVSMTRQFWVQTLAARVEPVSSGGSIFLIRGAAAAGATTEGLRDLFRQLDLFTRADHSSNLEEARRRAVNRLILENDRPPVLLQRIAAGVLEGEPDDGPARLQRAIPTVTAEAVAKVSREILRVHAMTLAVAGNPGLFDAPLSALNLPVTDIDITIPRPATLAARTDPQSLEQGKIWLARMQQAMGGREKLAAIRDFVVESEGAVTIGNRIVALTGKETWLAGDTYRQDQSMPGRRMHLFYNGKIGWLSDGARLAPLSPATVKQLKGEIFRLLFRLAVSDALPDRTVSYQGSGVLFISDADHSARVYLDESTALPRRLVYLNVAADGSAVPAEQSLEDWREVDGFHMPFRVIARQGGVKYSDQTVKSMRFNSGLKIEEVEKKP